MHQAYIGYGLNKSIVENSSSGGLFAIFAEYIIKKGGVVYGAAIVYDKNILECKHIRIEKLADLYRIQGSKYTQSKTEGVFRQVEKDLEMGKTVLFSGTSCQIYALKHLVDNNEKLYTVDLVCHGVPQKQLFREYIDFLERTKKCRITNIKFRQKNKYCLFVQKENIRGVLSEEIIPSYKSAYYRLFLLRAAYRKSCYNCKWASINKPSDITLGDFKPTADELIKYQLNKAEVYSSIIIHSNKGRELLENVNQFTTTTQITMEEMISHHANLRHPSVMNLKGKFFYFIYRKFGFKNLQRWIDINNSLRNIYFR